MTRVDFAALVADRFGEAADPGWKELPEMEAVARILGRRTQRAYSDRAVDDALIGLLCRAALSASSKSDFQQVSILRVLDADKRAALAAPFPAMPWIGAAPVFLVFLGDARRLERVGSLRGHLQDNGSLEGFFNATVDAAVAMQTFILAAESVGLGTCPISVLRNEAPLVGKVLQLPDKVVPVAGLCVGWPQHEGHVSMRLPTEVTLHVDTYDDAALAEAIEHYDVSREARNPTPREKQRSPARFGFTERYGWSEDKARQSAQGEGAAFPPWLRARGFGI